MTEGRKDYTEICKEINDLIENENLLREIERIKQKIDSLKNTEFYTQINDIFLNCKYYIAEAKEAVKEAIEMPLYTGVIGHYSHGKSCLLNALLFDEDKKEKELLLPMGEGVVTGKPTLIKFKEDSNEHEIYKVYVDDSEELIDEESYKALVSERGEKLVKEARYFRICFSVKKLAKKGIFTSMARNDVELFDTPGLGGPYWKDTELLREWFNVFKLIILCIKATDINDNVADNINPFLKVTTAPIIVVVTFWDKWKESPDYRNIVDEHDARKKAKELLKKYFPTLEDPVDEDRIIFCSPKGYFKPNGIKIPDIPHSDRFYTNDWNIDAVRNSLEKYVVMKKDAILKGTSKGMSFLAKSKKEIVVNTSEKLISAYKSLQNSLAHITEKPDSSRNFFNSLKSKYAKRVKETYDDYIWKIVREYVNKLNSEIKKKDIDIKEVIMKMNEDVKIKIKKDGDFYDEIKEVTRKNLINELERYIKKEKTGISQEKIYDFETKVDEKLEEVKKEIENFIDKVEFFQLPDESILDIGAALDFLNTVWNGNKGTFFPIISLACVVGGGFLYFLKNKNPSIGISIIIGGVLLFSVIIPFIKERSEYSRKKMEAVKEYLNKTKSNNNEESVQLRMKKYEKIFDDFIDGIGDLFSETFGEAQETKSDTLKEIRRITSTELDNFINDLERKVAELKIQI